MYDYYFCRLESFWQKRKWWIVVVFALIAAAGIATNFWPKTPEQKIKAALADYHKANGQPANIKILSFVAVKNTFSDSMRYAELVERHGHFIKEARFALDMYGIDSVARFNDSLDFLEREIRQLEPLATSPAPTTFTKCNYTAEISSPAERFIDTLSVVLNDRFSVVWRN